MKRPEFLKQKIMLRVIFALAPVAVAGVYFFGWRVSAILAVSILAAFITEWIMTAARKSKISYACFVTAVIFALSLPPTIPLWIVFTGAVTAILFGKEVFGGFGRNVFNPAIVGRTFIYVAFPVEMTSSFVPAFSGFPGGLAEWAYSSSGQAADLAAASSVKVADAISAATPIFSRRDFGFEADISSLFFGNIGGQFSFQGYAKILTAGSIGEVSAFIIILAGVFLLVTKTAQWRLMLSTIAGAVVLNLILRNIAGISQVPPLPFTLFSGALLYAAVFMATDPVSAPKEKLSQWVYGSLIGALIVFFRYKSVFAGAVGFAILFGNIFSPSLDLWIRRYKTRKMAENQ